MNEIIRSALLFKTLGDITRIKIVASLFEEEKSVKCIAEEISLSQSAVSHQLKLLKDIDLVRFRRSGKKMLYSISDEHIKTIIEQVFKHVKDCEESG